MANLRTNNLSGEQGQNAYRGSVFFPGYVNGAASSYLSIADNDDLDMGTGDFTFEAWIRPVKQGGTNDPNYMGFFSAADYASSDGSITIQVKNDGKLRYVINAGNGDDETGSTVLWGDYHHVAIVRSSGTIKGYVNGVEEISSSYSSAVDFTHGGSTVIGELAIDNYAGDYPFCGYISNLRLVKGTAVYTTNNFTPPTSELTIIPNTVLLCCQDSDDPTQEATGKTITANGLTDLTNRTDNLIKNGRFTTSATENWTLSGGTAALGTGQSSTFGDGNHLVLTASSSYAYLKQSFTTVIGRTYRTDAQSNGGDASFISTSTSESDYVISDIRGGKTFIATQTTYHLILRASTGGGNFDTVSVHELENSVQPKVIPPYGVDAGNIFGGPIQQSSQGYMYFPTGRTEERGGSRGVCAGGSDPSGRDNDISFIDIQSQGNAMDFGDLSINSHNTAGFSSKTRAIFSLGYIDASPNVSNTLEFITMMTQGNATDFGDTTFTTYEGGAASNDTRGLIAGGYNASPVNNVTNIDFVTIASLGNGSDFGDLTVGRRGLQGCGSPTRSVFASGYQQPDTGTKTNVIDFVTIATAGNAQDFGDLTSQRWGTSACADSTRGVFSGGLTPSDLDIIDFITIATTGNATDFGDLIADGGRGSSTSNSIRGVNFHGIGSYVNTIGFVIIQTTGNEVDFGDNTYKSHGQGSGSTAHGGLS